MAPACAKSVMACLALLHSLALSWRSLTPVRLPQLRDEVAKYKVGAPARVGLVAPNDVNCAWRQHRPGPLPDIFLPGLASDARCHAWSTFGASCAQEHAFHGTAEHS